MRVLLRAWDEAGREAGLEKFADMGEVMLNTGDLCYIGEIKASVPVHCRPDVPDERADAELRFELPVGALRLLREAGWGPIDCPCTTCPPKQR